MNWFIGYYVVCIIYCFYQLFKKYNDRYNEGMIGLSPGLDAIMVVVMAWILAPVDVSITWIRMVRDAEQARINQSKIDVSIDENDNIY